MEQYFNPNGERLDLREQIAKGPEGAFYMLSTGKIAKIFHRLPLPAEREAKLRAMVARQIVMDGVTWPEDLVLNDKQEVVGYAMPRDKGRTIQKTMWGKALLEKSFPRWTRVRLANVSLCIVQIFDFLHEQNILVGDVNGLMINVQSDKEVYFTNADRYQIDIFPCPYATPLFTPPELNDVDFATYIRAKEDEYFAIAVVLFKTLFPGKDPFALHEGKLSFIYHQETNRTVRKGSWEHLWIDQGTALKTGFRRVFENNERLSPKQWTDILLDYIENIESGKVSDAIFPSSVGKRSVENRSTSMNLNDEAGGVTETLLTPGEDSLAVLELSTKAVKVLIGDLPRLAEEGFSFEAFYREADLTNTGTGLSKENEMDLEFFDEEVIPSIERMVELARRRRIGRLYTVATAAYRGATNRDALLSLIKAQTGINVGVLSKAQEAEATLTAFKFSRVRTMKLLPEMMLIDQGGGSTEISLFSMTGDLRHELKQTCSLDVGTSVLQNILFEASDETPLMEALRGVDEIVEDKITEYFERFPADEVERTCISVGSCITHATGKKGNRHQHCMVMTAKHLIRALETTEDKLIKDFKTVGKLKLALEDEQLSRDGKQWIDNFLTIRLGLPMYMNVLGEYDINEVIVSGTGLWYGVFFQKATPILNAIIAQSR